MFVAAVARSSWSWVKLFLSQLERHCFSDVLKPMNLVATNEQACNKTTDTMYSERSFCHKLLQFDRASGQQIYKLINTTASPFKWTLWRLEFDNQQQSLFTVDTSTHSLHITTLYFVLCIEFDMSS